METLDKLYDIFLEHPVITTDSRDINDGCIFFALKGENFDGNDYAREAVEKGAFLAVVEKEQAVADHHILIVDDVLMTLQNLAGIHRKKIGAKVIGITGTNGKTTTKELINRVLATSFTTTSTKGNLNNHIGVPLTLLGIGHETEIAVIEMGANHIGEIAQLCDIAAPNFGLITNIGRAHLEGFGSYAGVIKAKTELYEYLRNTHGLVFLNSDNDLLLNHAKGIAEYTYGTGPGANCRGKLLRHDPLITLEWHDEENRYLLDSNLYGAYNFENMMAAIAIGRYFGISPHQINNAIAAYSPSNNRSQVIRTKRNNTLILDAYNANPSSMESAVKNFLALKSETKVLILGDMLELGNDSQEEHIRLLKMVQESGINPVFLVGSIFYSLPIPEGFYKFENVDQLGRWLDENEITDHQILIKGSRKVRLENLSNLL